MFVYNLSACVFFCRVRLHFCNDATSLDLSYDPVKQNIITANRNVHQNYKDKTQAVINPNYTDAHCICFTLSVSKRGIYFRLQAVPLSCTSEHVMKAQADS